MSSYLSSNLIPLWLGFMLIASGGCIEGIRRLVQRERTARGERK